MLKTAKEATKLWAEVRLRTTKPEPRPCPPMPPVSLILERAWESVVRSKR
jgi:hypothetical protein